MSKWIDADALKDELQQHHDFWVMAWGGFGKMPIGEKKRVDEITNCIAEVVNAPTIEPEQGEWIDKAISIIDDMQREGIIDYEQAWEFRMRARMKGADDE